MTAAILTVYDKFVNLVTVEKRTIKDDVPYRQGICILISAYENNSFDSFSFTYRCLS